MDGMEAVACAAQRCKHGCSADVRSLLLAHEMECVTQTCKRSAVFLWFSCPLYDWEVVGLSTC
jgi:hypothetical protein